MELIVYFDSNLTNRQKLSPKQKPECDLKTIAMAIEPNYYAYSLNGGETIVRNPDYQSPKTSFMKTMK